MVNVGIINCGMANVGSVSNMLSYIGINSMLCDSPNQLEEVSHIILPGVGRFDKLMQALESRDLIAVLRQKAEAGTPILGICLGMQILASRSEEGEPVDGLNLIPGKIKKIDFKDENGASVKVPHMGWSYVDKVKESEFTQKMEISENQRFYFVHSYHYDCSDQANVLYDTEYGNQRFVSGVQCGNVIGLQFHPEKSHKYGMDVLTSFTSLSNIK